MLKINIKRIYDPTGSSDGVRILVDRLWPRGIKKESAQLSLWLKDIAPSNELRKWYSHKPERFEEFRIRYLNELRNDYKKSGLVDGICQLAMTEKVTLLFSAKDRHRNNAQVLKNEILLRASKYDVKQY